MRIFAIVIVGLLVFLIGYGFGVVDTLCDIRKGYPDLYEALRARVKEEDHATD